MATNPEQLFEDLEQQKAAALESDLDLANTFLDRVRITRREENRRQSIADARNAFDSISYYLPRLRCPQEEINRLSHRLEDLRKRLTDVGESV